MQTMELTLSWNFSEQWSSKRSCVKMAGCSYLFEFPLGNQLIWKLTLFPLCSLNIHMCNIQEFLLISDLNILRHQDYKLMGFFWRLSILKHTDLFIQTINYFDILWISIEVKGLWTERISLIAGKDMESIIPLDGTVMNLETWQRESLAECHSHWLIRKGVWCDCLKQSTEGQHGPIPSANRNVESSQSCMTASSSNPDSSV